MTSPPLHRGAVHEAGHAVMAHCLGASLGPITIDLAGPCAGARTHVSWPNGKPSLDEKLRVAAAARICLRAFGLDTILDTGPFKDEVCIYNALEEMFPDDAARQEDYRNEVEAEIANRFDQPNVRAAAKELVDALTSRGKIDGHEAEAIIDLHLAKAPP